MSLNPTNVGLKLPTKRQTVYARCPNMTGDTADRATYNRLRCKICQFPVKLYGDGHVYMTT